jgi:tRNA nucleotidyltransferase/poly(A) polymerase
MIYKKLFETPDKLYLDDGGVVVFAAKNNITFITQGDSYAFCQNGTYVPIPYASISDTPYKLAQPVRIVVVDKNVVVFQKDININDKMLMSSPEEKTKMLSHINFLEFLNKLENDEGLIPKFVKGENIQGRVFTNYKTISLWHTVSFDWMLKFYSVFKNVAERYYNVNVDENWDFEIPNKVTTYMKGYTKYKISSLHNSKERVALINDAYKNQPSYYDDSYNRKVSGLLKETKQERFLRLLENPDIFYVIGDAGNITDRLYFDESDDNITFIACGKSIVFVKNFNYYDDSSAPFYVIVNNGKFLDKGYITEKKFPKFGSNNYGNHSRGDVIGITHWNIGSFLDNYKQYNKKFVEDFLNHETPIQGRIFPLYNAVSLWKQVSSSWAKTFYDIFLRVAENFSLEFDDDWFIEIPSSSYNIEQKNYVLKRFSEIIDDTNSKNNVNFGSWKSMEPPEGIDLYAWKEIKRAGSEYVVNLLQVMNRYKKEKPKVWKKYVEYINDTYKMQPSYYSDNLNRMADEMFLLEDTLKDWSSSVQKYDMLVKALEVIKIINQYGKAYIVGGSVRDILMGKEPNDIDIATTLSTQEIKEIFQDSSDNIGQSEKFGIVMVKYQNYNFEIAQLRNDGEYSDGRRPETVELGVSEKEDAARRDFTINSMLIDVDGNILDYFGGQTDIQNKKIRAVGNANDRFKEDKLRIMRAIRFASRLGFEIEPDTFNAIKDNANAITNVSVERITKELVKMAEQTGDKFADAIVTLKDAGILQKIIPEIVEMEKFDQSLKHHPEGAKVKNIITNVIEDYNPQNQEHLDDTKYLMVKKGNVLDHTLAALRQNKIADPIINLSILLHDVGKIKTFKMSEDGKMRYLYHAEVGVNVVNDICDRLKIDNKTRRAIVFATLNHMKMHEVLNMRTSKIYNLIQNEDWDVLYAVTYCDDICRKGANTRWDEVGKKIEELVRKFKDSKAIKDVVNGELVMKTLNIPPGKKVGYVIQKTINWILDKNIDIHNVDAITRHMRQYKNITI